MTTGVKKQTAPHPVFTFLVNWGVYGVVLLLVLFGALRFNGQFFSGENMLTTILPVGVLGIVAVGVAFVTYSGHYADLSVPATMAFAGIIAVSALRYGLFAGLLAGLLAGLAIGAVNGVLIGLLRVNPIIWTLAMGSIMGGLLRLLFSGQQVYPEESTTAGKMFLVIYSAHFHGVPVIIILLAAMVLLGSCLMFGTRFGVQLKLIGAAYEVARLTGIAVRGQVAWAFVISSLAASVGGILLTSFNKVGTAEIGAGYDFSAITAIVIGGVTLAGGRGSILGVLGGVLVIGLLQNILSLWGVGSYTKDIIQGIVFIVVVGTQALYLRRLGRDDA